MEEKSGQEQQLFQVFVSWCIASYLQCLPDVSSLVSRNFNSSNPTMGNRRISADVKICAMQLYERGLLTINDIIDCVGFSCSTFFCVLKLYQETGHIVNDPSLSRGRPRILHHDNITYLLQLIRLHPDWFLDKLLSLLKRTASFPCTIQQYTMSSNNVECLSRRAKRLLKNKMRTFEMTL